MGTNIFLATFRGLVSILCLVFSLNGWVLVVKQRLLTDLFALWSTQVLSCGCFPPCIRWPVCLCNRADLGEVFFRQWSESSAAQMEPLTGSQRPWSHINGLRGEASGCFSWTSNCCQSVWRWVDKIESDRRARKQRRGCRSGRRCSHRSMTHPPTPAAPIHACYFWGKIHVCYFRTAGAFSNLSDGWPQKQSPAWFECL